MQKMAPAPVLRSLQLPSTSRLQVRPRMPERHLDRRSTACRPALSSAAVSMAQPVLSPSTDAEPQRHKVAIFVVCPRPPPDPASVSTSGPALCAELVTAFECEHGCKKVPCTFKTASHAGVAAALPADDAFPQHVAPARSRNKQACAQEPSPFSHVSGMKNRFECLIQGLRAAGDDVMVFTPDRNPPRKYFGAKVCHSFGHPLVFVTHRPNNQP